MTIPDLQPRDPNEWKSSLSVHPDHARLIGCIIGSWNSAEHYWAAFLTLMVQGNSDFVHAMLYALESPKARLNAIAAALALLVEDKEELARYTGLMDESKQVLKRRNDFGHYRYLHNDDGKLKIVKLREHHRPLKDISHTLSIRELEVAFDRSRRLEGAVVELVKEQLRKLPPEFAASLELPDDPTS